MKSSYLRCVKTNEYNLFRVRVTVRWTGQHVAISFPSFGRCRREDKGCAPADRMLFSPLRMSECTVGFS